MIKRIYETPKGPICYWVNDRRMKGACTLIFLPGLTADHRLFDKQIEYFEGKCNIFVWDAPGHGDSWPFQLDFTLMDKAVWLDEILGREKITRRILVGQSMGGYVAQAYMERFPKKVTAFVSIDSAPLQRQYVSGMEIFLLRHMTWVYRLYPWKSLLKAGSEGCATSEYGISLMREIMMTYDGQKARYAKLAGHGYRMLAEAIAADLPYRLDCPVQLICGTKDKAGSTKKYNKAWTKRTGLCMEWIEGAGHNSNTDAPEKVNRLIEKLVLALR